MAPPTSKRKTPLKSDQDSNYQQFSLTYMWLINPQGSRDGAVVRALASHQCGPGSITGLGIICGLSLLLILVPVPRVFESGYSGFPPSTKTNISKFQFKQETVERRTTPWIPLKFPYIYLVNCFASKNKYIIHVHWTMFN